MIEDKVSGTRGLRRDSLALSTCPRGGASTTDLLVQNSRDPMPGIS